MDEGYLSYRDTVYEAARYALYVKHNHIPAVDSAGMYALEIRLYLTSIKNGDWDNTGGTFSDALQNLIYADDAQVMEGRVRKILIPKVPKQEDHHVQIFVYKFI